MSNQAICSGVGTDVAYYIRVAFPVQEEGTSIQFTIPTDFNIFGMAAIDGEYYTLAYTSVTDGT
jgi:hypothetical protein